MSVTHVAGVVVTIGGRCIQRCGLCGEKLVDTRNVHVCNVWPLGGFIQCEGDRQEIVPPIVDEDSPHGRLPDDNCLELVEN